MLKVFRPVRGYVTSGDIHREGSGWAEVVGTGGRRCDEQEVDETRMSFKTPCISTTNNNGSKQIAE